MTVKNRVNKPDRKTAQPTPVCQLKRAPVAPPVYRPQPTPRVLQRKQMPGTSPKPPVSGPPPRIVRPIVQAKPLAKPTSPTPPHRPPHGPPSVIQRMMRPKREGVNYDRDYSANAPSDAENLREFARLARANISALKRGVTLQPERNLPQDVRGEETKAYIMAKAMRITISEGSSGGNQHGESRALDAAEWRSTIQGYQYYFVCEGGKPSCYLCTAIASLLKIAVAATDESTYSDYVAPACLQSDDDLWKAFIGDDAYELWTSFGEARRARLRSNLGWVHEMGLYWQG